uniref:Uncharacterized protein n=1 Tax=Cyanistes caeruleus TaxID=156563 RepID=A0A8C0VRH9_CYACU
LALLQSTDFLAADMGYQQLVLQTVSGHPQHPEHAGDAAAGQKVAQGIFPLAFRRVYCTNPCAGFSPRPFQLLRMPPH